MADISVLARLLNGALRNVDLTTNTPVVLSVKVGGGISNTELTKTLVDNLVTLSGGGDAGSLHNHNGAYNTKAELSSATSSSGSDLIGDDNTYSNFTPAAATVKGALSGIDSALAAATGTKVKVSATDTTSGYLDESLTAGAGLSKSITNPAGNEVLDLAVNVDGSTIEINADALSLKALGITNSHVSASAAIVESKLALDFSTSSLNTAIGTKISSSEKGANNGVATLDAGGKVPVSQLPNSVMTFEGVWDASTNTPTLADNANGANAGMVYLVSVAGTQNLGSGSQTFAVGDWVVANSSNVWQKSVNSNAVVSVNSQTGVVTINAINQLTGDITAGPASGSQSAAATIAAGAVTGAKIASDTITNSNINSAAAIAYSKLNISNSIVNADINSAAAIAYSKLNLSNSIVAGDITSDAVTTAKILNANVTAAKLASNVADQSTITGGAGSALAVQSAPLMKRTLVAGEAFAANTSFLVRWALTGETAGQVYKADKDASTSNKYMAIGIALSTGAVSAGGNIDVVMMGEFTLGSSDSAFASGDVGKEVFVGSSGAFILGAALANTANEAQFCVGVVQTTSKIWIDAKQLRGIA